MKPGIKTTEFWTTILATIIVAGGAEFGLTLDAASVAGIAGMVITYTMGRVFSK
jgi:membrane protein DedA with SNARE-associated domain